MWKCAKIVVILQSILRNNTFTSPISRQKCGGGLVFVVVAKRVSAPNNHASRHRVLLRGKMNSWSGSATCGKVLISCGECDK